LNVPLFSKQLSAGQLAIRDHAGTFLPQWNSSGAVQDRDRISEELRIRCLSDERVVQDPLLKQPLGFTQYSSHFFEYLHSHSSSLESRNYFEPQEDFHFVYQRPDLDSTRITSMYSGGIKYPSTFSCVMGLIAEKPLTGWDWGLTYFKNERILTISGGGNHRTLAHLLIGNYQFTPFHTKVTVTTNLPIPAFEMNQALLEIQKLYGSNFDRRFNFESAGQDPKLLLHFLQSSNPEQREIISAFFRDEENEYHWGLQRRTETSAQVLIELLKVFEHWRDRPKWKRFFFGKFEHEVRFAFSDANRFREFLSRKGRNSVR
jgi:hypothetical protein